MLRRVLFSGGRCRQAILWPGRLGIVQVFHRQLCLALRLDTACFRPVSVHFPPTFQRPGVIRPFVTVAALDESSDTPQRPSNDDTDREVDDYWSATAGDPLSVDTGENAWGSSVLEATTDVLSLPIMHGLALYSFRAAPGNRVYIALDKVSDQYGSPNTEDIEAFQQSLMQQLETSTETGNVADLEIEVSSPGIERAVHFPNDLQRFAELPMKVEFTIDVAEKQQVVEKILSFQGQDPTNHNTLWRLANVRANRSKGTAKLSKRRSQEQFQIALTDILKVNLHCDV